MSQTNGSNKQEIISKNIKTIKKNWEFLRIFEIFLYFKYFKKKIKVIK